MRFSKKQLIILIKEIHIFIFYAWKFEYFNSGNIIINGRLIRKAKQLRK